MIHAVKRYPYCLDGTYVHKRTLPQFPSSNLKRQKIEEDADVPPTLHVTDLSWPGLGRALVRHYKRQFEISDADDKTHMRRRGVALPVTLVLRAEKNIYENEECTHDDETALHSASDHSFEPPSVSRDVDADDEMSSVEEIAISEVSSEDEEAEKADASNAEEGEGEKEGGEGAGERDGEAGADESGEAKASKRGDDAGSKEEDAPETDDAIFQSFLLALKKKIQHPELRYKIIITPLIIL